MSGDRVVKGIAVEAIREGDMVVAELGRVRRLRGSLEARRPDVYLAVASEPLETGDYVEFAQDNGDMRASRRRG